MNRQVKTRKSVIITLAAGFGLGAITMAGIQTGATVTRAFAQEPIHARTISATSAENMAALRNLDNSYANLADFAAPAVVDIRATSGREMTATGQRMPVRGGEGSGFIFRPDGYIITNDHVVGGFDNVTVVLKDGREFPGKVTRAHDSDIAVVKIEAKNLPTLSFGDSSKVRVGQTCMAVGAPFGLKNSVTFGHISALGRETVIGDEGGGMFNQGDADARLYPDLIQTDASINMGNSGGPLINIDGQVVGINSAIYSPSGTSAGIGFAIPSNQAKFIADMLIEKGKVTRAMIGLIPENLKDFQKKDMGLAGGALVSVDPDPGPAKTAGIKKGDVIVKIGDTPVTSQLDLRNAMLVYAPGTTVPVEIVRDGKHTTLNVKLAEYAKPKTARRQQVVPQDGRGFGFPKDFDFDIPKLFKDFPNQGGNDSDVPPVREGKARLGVSVQNVSEDARQQFNLPSSVNGAVVVEVQPGSVADRLGMKPGDVITGFNGKSVDGSESLTQAIGKVNWGDTGRIQFERYSKNGSAKQDVTVTFK